MMLLFHTQHSMMFSLFRTTIQDLLQLQDDALSLLLNIITERGLERVDGCSTWQEVRHGPHLSQDKCRERICCGLHSSFLGVCSSTAVLIRLTVTLCLLVFAGVRDGYRCCKTNWHNFPHSILGTFQHRVLAHHCLRGGPTISSDDFSL